MSADSDLLKLAAKAAGIRVNPSFNLPNGIYIYGQRNLWNPLTNDGDALRLAVKLKMLIDIGDSNVMVISGDPEIESFDNTLEFDGDDYAAVRRGIVIAAAEVGKAMP